MLVMQEPGSSHLPTSALNTHCLKASCARQYSALSPVLLANMGGRSGAGVLTSADGTSNAAQQ